MSEINYCIWGDWKLMRIISEVIVFSLYFLLSLNFMVYTSFEESDLYYFLEEDNQDKGNL
jgi:hypothetical protein